MKTMNEANASVFTELQLINPDCKIFQIENGKSLDAHYLLLYGNRMTFDDFDSQGTANAVNALYVQNWNDAFDLFTSSGELMKDMGNMTSTVTTKDYEYTDSINDTQKLPAYDSVDLQTDKDNTKSLTHKDVTNVETVKSDSRDISRFGVAFNYLQKNLLHDIVYKDLNALATLSIHTY